MLGEKEGFTDVISFGGARMLGVVGIIVCQYVVRDFIV